MWVFAATIFLSAFLLFQVQPLIAKFILPWFGGAPNVWTTCMLFFQLVLLGGYLYADLLIRFLRPRMQAIVHAIVLVVAVLFLPIIPADAWRPEGTESPTLRILLLLAVSIGLPYFVLSTTGPLVQAWFGRRFVGRSPYRLFALSNAGSMLALLSFPFLFEPVLATRMHAWWWGAGFVVFVGLCLCTIMMSQRVADPGDAVPPQALAQAAASEADQVTWGQWLWWLALSLVPSVLLLATTNHICQDVAVVPLLWIAPLTLYLLSFIICFDKPAWYRRDVWGGLFAAATIAAVYCLFQGRPFGMIGTTLVFLGMMFTASMVCHGELARLRPGLRLITAYYLMISLGGALGGVFVVLLAPRIFVGFYELHLALGAAVILGLWRMVATADWPALYRIGLVGSMTGAGFGYAALIDPLREVQRHWPSRLAIMLALGLAAIFLLGFPFRYERRPSESQGNGSGQFGGRQVLLVALLLGWLGLFLGLLWRPVFTLDFLIPVFVIWGVVTLLAAWVGRGGWFRGPQALRGLGLAFAVVGGVLAIALLWAHANKPEPELVHRSRDFYGLLAIRREFNDTDGESLHMFNGRVFHGFQFTQPEFRMRRTSHYGESSGVGKALLNHPKRLAGQPLRVGVIGLGTGSLAAYAEPGDTWVFYEINADCVDLAWKDFYYLSENPASDRTVVHTGDGRILLERQAETGELQNFDILIVDAFTGGGIPRHLVTQECFELYRRHLQPDGIIAFHISNRYLDLKPVIYALSDEAGWETRIFHYSPQRNSPTARYESTSTWLLCSPNRKFFELPQIAESGVRWGDDRRVLWTDDFGGIWQVFIFRPPEWWNYLRDLFASPSSVTPK